MQGKTLYTILLSIIAVLTLAVAVLVIFLFTLNSNKAQAVKTADPKSAQRVVPPDEQAELKLYDQEEAPFFILKYTEDNPKSILKTSISVIFDSGKKGKLLEKRTELINKNLSKMKQANIQYFMGKSYDELRAPDAMEKSAEALLDIYNGILSDNPEEKIILSIVFDEWFVQ